MIATILDTKTGETHRSAVTPSDKWVKGAYDCDCWREKDTTCPCTASCSYERYLVIAVDYSPSSNERRFTLEEYNSNYPKELLMKHNIVFINDTPDTNKVEEPTKVEATLKRLHNAQAQWKDLFAVLEKDGIPMDDPLWVDRVRLRFLEYKSKTLVLEGINLCLKEADTYREHEKELTADMKDAVGTVEMHSRLIRAAGKAEEMQERIQAEERIKP